MAHIDFGWLWQGPRAVPASLHDGKNSAIRQILGPTAWLSLPHAVRVRFQRIEPTVYEGKVETELSLVGRFFALMLFAFGAPIPLFSGRSSASVLVRSASGGMCWTRVYRGPFGMSFSIQSVKRLAMDGRLFECCAGGWTMWLDVSVDQGDLLFRARGYFWRCGPVSIGLPVWMTPGIAVIRHTDMGNGQFHFMLTFDHPWFGRTVGQSGVFNDQKA